MNILIDAHQTRHRHSVSLIYELLKNNHKVYLLDFRDNDNYPVEPKLTKIYILKGSNFTLKLENDSIKIEKKVFKIDKKLNFFRYLLVKIKSINIKRQSNLFKITRYWNYEKQDLIDLILKHVLTFFMYAEMNLKDNFLEKRQKRRIEILHNDKIVEKVDELISELQKIKDSTFYDSNFEEILFGVIRRKALRSNHNVVFKDLLKNYEIDRVLFTSLVFPSHSDALLKVAKNLQIPTIYQVFSWDNLSSKSSILFEPDKYLVWNYNQQLELLIHHKVTNSIDICGSSRFDYEEWLINRNKEIPVFNILFIGSSFLGYEKDLALFRNLNSKLSELDFRFKIRFIYRKHRTQNFTDLDFFNSLSFNNNNLEIVLTDHNENLQKSVLNSNIIFAQNTSAVFEAMIWGKIIYTIGKFDDSKSIHFNYIKELGVNLNSIEEAIIEITKKIDEFNLIQLKRTELLNFLNPLNTTSSIGKIEQDALEKTSLANIEYINDKQIEQCINRYVTIFENILKIQ